MVKPEISIVYYFTVAVQLFVPRAWLAFRCIDIIVVVFLLYGLADGNYRYNSILIHTTGSSSPYWHPLPCCGRGTVYCMHG